MELFCKALCKAQAEFGPVKKTKVMQMQGRKPYKYADLADVMDAIRLPLAKNEIFITQDEEQNEGGGRLRSEAIHSSGQKIVNYTRICTPRDDGPQSHGAMLTYARRYGICNLLGIVAEDDTDGVVESQEQRVLSPKMSGPIAGTNAVSGVLTEPQLKRLFAISKKTGWAEQDIRDYLKTMGLTSTKELNLTQYEHFCGKMEQFPKTA